MSCDCNTLIVGEAGPQGAQGLAGINGTNGTNGVNAFTTLGASFTQPSVSSTETITVGTNEWMAVGQAIYISQAGFYTVDSLSGATQVTVTLVKTDGISPASTVSSGRKISPSAVATYSAPLSSLTVNGDSSLDGSVVINESGADKDSRIEGDTDVNLVYTDASADRVGIGTAAPETKLHVVKDGVNSLGLKVGTAATGADAVFTQAAIFNNNQSSSGDFSVKSVGSDPLLFVDASANFVGIGTNSPSALLDVAGDTETNTILVNPGSVNGSAVLQVNGSSGAAPLIVNATTNRVGIRTASPTVELDVTGATQISGNLTVDTSTLIVNSSTNKVGILTLSPTVELDVTGATQISGNLTVDTSTLIVNASTDKVGIKTAVPTVELDVTGAAKISGDFTVDTSTLFVDSANNRVGIGTTTLSAGSKLTIAGGDLIVNTDDLFVNYSNGRVGVGTTSPTTELDVTGTVNVNGALQRKAPVTKTTVGFTIGDSENWIIVNYGGTSTVTLPAAGNWIGREIMIKTIQAQAVDSASSNVCPVTSATPGTSILTATAGKWATLVSDGTNWIIMAGN